MDLGSHPGVIVTGWGRPCDSCALPIALQQTVIPVISDAACTAQWGSEYNGDVHICAWDDVAQDKGACHGDRGGPLVVNGELHGIASWDEPSCSSSRPRVFTRLNRKFPPWICTVTVGNACF
ncbi:MAG: trypsin-like serine protease [bacterium]|nr:trypsin-like serine protease [bacterium]